MGNNILDVQANIQNHLEYHETRNRPSSYYENSSEISSVSSPNAFNLRNEYKSERIPSQMDYLSTTVPLNMANQNIAGKHTPTRNSLRHSRMIVLNKTGNVPLKYLPTVIVHYKFIKSLLMLITFFGTVLCTLSVLLLLWSPNIRSRDNTYWSAIPVISSGITGLLYLCFMPRDHSTNRFMYWTKSLQIISTSTSLIAAVASFIMCVFAVVHAVALSTMTCAPPDKINTSCMCELNSTRETSLITSYHYVDLSCSDVNNMFYIIVIPTCITNAVVGMCEVLYLYLQWCRRNSYIYSKVSVNNNPDIVNTNSGH